MYLRQPMYRILRNILFLLPAETAHYFSMNLLKVICAFEPFRKMLSKIFAPSGLTIDDSRFTHFGLQFKNRIGLGAGFDKNAKYLRELEVLGFGFVEIGTVTPLPQQGNPKPRLFRLPKDKALINRMGFNNHGVNMIAERLKKFRIKNPKSRMIIGGNIGKNKN